MMTRTTRIHWLADGRAIASDAAGTEDGVPVFFFHGLLSGRLIPDVAAAAATRQGVRLISLDRPGIGLSDFKDGRRVLDWPQDVAEVADLLGIERFRLFGVSGGSGYVLASCFKMPERVARAATASGLTPFAQAGIVHRIVPKVIDPLVMRSIRVSSLAHRALVTGMRRAPERATDAIKGTVPACDREVLEQQGLSDFLIASALESARGGPRGLAYDDWVVNQPWGFTPAEVPASVEIDIWMGAEDTDVPIADAERLAGEVPGATLHVKEGTGHFGAIFTSLDDIFARLASDAPPATTSAAGAA